ncbi:flagellar assembly protein FliH [Salmonella enterica subsp. enterica serovar Choleraesuis]|nr:flagellar assembly protein FliH [Salmonella enterica subsp. enterica serovar Choleraesuis]
MSDSVSWRPWIPDDLGASPIAEEEEQNAEPADPIEPEPLVPSFANVEEEARRRGYEAGLQQGLQQGIDQGQQQGFAQGLEQGLEEIQRQQAPLLAQMQHLISEFQHSLDALDHLIPARLMQMALEAARKAIGQTHGIENHALIQHIQHLLAQEPLFSGKPLLRVHPDDLPLVERLAGPALALHGWKTRGDPSLHPGGCKISADEGELDASVALRWQELCRLSASEGEL